jgi:hypothetical protein
VGAAAAGGAAADPRGARRRDRDARGGRQARQHAFAKTVRLDDDGELTVRDGPFTETREVLGGYYVLDCDSMEEAVGWATRLRFMPGANEIRPIWE